MKYAGTPTAEVPSGFTPLAGPYFEHESWMVPRVVDDLTRSGIEYRVVEVRTVYGSLGSEVWRRQPSRCLDASRTL